MVNPIAAAITALGIVLLLAGLFLLVKRRRIAGVVISVFGLGIAAVPFLITAFLAESAP
ncbi:MAG: hypothetical protein M1434_07555 [Chloroflexi bacterium]|nr:hypothetical protein [Chloroflexota bacterium]MCL5274586.1 hypothetical protein [Chloroflexota bacterium]